MNFIPLHFALLLNFLALQSRALTSDGIVLLSFKYTILADPLSILSSWNYNDLTPCSWAGVSCTKSTLVDQMRVTSLILPNSQLSGFLSPHLSLISTLQELDLSSNSFVGSLPLTILNASNLQKLNLAHNAISGEIQTLIGTLPNLKLLNLSSNSLTGQIPGGFKFVEVLDLSSNSLTGSIPANFDGRKLKLLDLSRNKISGSIPTRFGLNISDEATIDISFNNLTGEIPQAVSFLNQKSEAFEGNAGLCGKPLPLLCSIPSSLSIPPKLNSSSAAAVAAIPKTITTSASNEGKQMMQQPIAIAGIAVGSIAALGLLTIVIVHQMKKRKTSKAPNSRQPPNPMKKSPYTHQVTILQNLSPSPEHHRSKQQPQTGRSGVLVSVNNAVLEMETLLEASAYVLGASNTSIVYKASMQNGRAFAVRRIGEGCAKKMKDFESEMRGIAKLRHPNLVRTLGFYWGEDEKLVIYDFVPNGSLASVFNRRTLGTSSFHLNLERRVRIATGLARGLACIHEKKQTHGNIKPSNVLLDSNFEPLISDFGLDRLILKSRSEGEMDSVSPYHAPELMKTLKVSTKSDVYSFGVVLLELLTGKALHDFELAPWTAASFTAEEIERLLKMVDAVIRDDVAVREDATLTCFKLGFSCSNLAPAKRPTMKEALQVLEKVAC